jgi:hypothetical protein
MAKVPVVTPLSAAKIERIAGGIASGYTNAWKGKEPVPVDLIFECDLDSLGIDSLYTDLAAQMGILAHGYTNSTKKVSIINNAVVDYNTAKGRRFFRATVGHELGHCFLHVKLAGFQASLQIAGIGFKRERSDLKPFEDPEWQAWRFCKALCMPEHLVMDCVRKFGFETPGINAMIKVFDMNYSFVISRLRDLKILPRQY